MRKIKIAQIGIGHDHASAVFENLKQQSDIFEVAGYAIPDSERGRFQTDIKSYLDSTEMTVDQILSSPDIEAVTIETEEVSLTKYALAAAKAGKHIHMDKPGSPNREEFRSVAEMQKQNGRVFHLGYMYRYNPFVIDLLRRVREGELGEIHGIEAQMNCFHVPDKRSWLGAFPDGMMFFLGCHLIDLALLLRGEPDNIIRLSRSTGGDGVSASDYGLVLFEYKNGVSILKTDAYETGGYARRQLTVVGSRETVELKPLERLEPAFESGRPGASGIFTGRTIYREADWNHNGEYEKSPAFGRYNKMMASFAEYVRGEKQNPFTYDYEMKLYDTLLRCCGVEI